MCVKNFKKLLKLLLQNSYTGRVWKHRETHLQGVCGMVYSAQQMKQRATHVTVTCRIEQPLFPGS